MLRTMTPTDEPSGERRTDEAVRAGRAADPEVVRQLADQLHRAVTQTFDDWAAGLTGPAEPAGRETRTYGRPAAVPPVRMEQMARTPEPTADLDDLVDLLVPRLLEKLVPALRDALRDDQRRTALD